MTIVEIQERVGRIREAEGDPEKAHDLEDALYHDVLLAVSQGGCDDPVACATEALKTQDLTFPRWCA